MTSDDLFALPPGEFVAARDALAKELRAAGDRDGAAAVKALPRPNAVAAALNALARGSGELLEAIWTAAASARGGAAVRDAIEAAVGQVDGSSATVDGVRRVLQDAAADSGVRAQVVEGRLSREPSAEDVDPLAAWAASLGEAPPKRAPAKKAPAKKPAAAKRRSAVEGGGTAGPSAEEQRAAERHAALEARLAESRELRDETARAAEAATRIAGEKRAEMEEARAEAERARAAAADAQKAARDAQAQAEEAAGALERAERTIRRLEGELSA